MRRRHRISAEWSGPSPHRQLGTVAGTVANRSVYLAVSQGGGRSTLVDATRWVHVRIDRSDSADEPEDARAARSAQSARDHPDAAGKDGSTAVSGDGPSHSPSASSDTTLRTERFAAHCAKVAAVYRQYAIDHGHARVEKLERDTIISGTGRIEADCPEADQVDPDDRLRVEGRPAKPSLSAVAFPHPAPSSPAGGPPARRESRARRRRTPCGPPLRLRHGSRQFVSGGSTCR